MATARTKTKLAPADGLKREIQAVLDPSEVKDQHRSGHGRFDGHAYAAAEAYFKLAGGYDTGLRPVQLKRRGRSHWWLIDESGRVIDLALAPRESSDFPYDRGVRRPFRHTPAGISQRAQAIVDRVKAARS